MYNVSLKIKEILHWSRNEETHNNEKTHKSGSLLVEQVWVQNKLTSDHPLTPEYTRLNPLGLCKRNHTKCSENVNSSTAGTGAADQVGSIWVRAALGNA